MRFNKGKGLICAVLAVIAVPAVAVGAPSEPTIEGPETSSYNGSIQRGGTNYFFDGDCIAQAGVAKPGGGFEPPTVFAVTVQGNASTDNPFVTPLATGAICRVVDRTNTSIEYGQIRAAAPGAAAPGANTVEVPFGKRVKVCLVVSGTFSDGFGGSQGNC